MKKGLKMINKNPVLYVIVRNDINSLSEGKKQAHSGHAASAFAYNAFYNDEPDSLVQDWLDQSGRGFGTQINLDGGVDEMHSIYEYLLKNAGQDIKWSDIVDETYPYFCHINKQVTFRAETTAMYVFGDKDNEHIIKALGNLKLAP